MTRLQICLLLPIYFAHLGSPVKKLFNGIQDESRLSMVQPRDLELKGLGSWVAGVGLYGGGVVGELVALAWLAPRSRLYDLSFTYALSLRCWMHFAAPAP